MIPQTQPDDNPDPDGDDQTDRLKSALLFAIAFALIGLAITQGTAAFADMDGYVQVHELDVDDHDGDVHEIAFHYNAETSYDATITLRLIDHESGDPLRELTYQAYVPKGENHGEHEIAMGELEPGTYQYEIELTIDATRLVDKTETYRTPPFTIDGE
jgi:hypothetical protein